MEDLHRRSLFKDERDDAALNDESGTVQCYPEANGVRNHGLARVRDD